jgi:hypothetical protein
MIARREFITLLGGAAAWPLAARGQQRERLRRIGVLMPSAADDPEYQARMTAFLQGLAQLGWLDGRNVRIDIRWAVPMPTEFANTRRNWSPSRPTSSWRFPARLSHHCCRRPAAFQSYWRLSLTRLARATSKAWRGRAAMPPVLLCSNTVSLRNGWSCSKRLRPESRGWRSFENPPSRLDLLSSA